ARAFILVLMAVVLVCAGLLALQSATGRRTRAAAPEKFDVPADPKSIEAGIAALDKDVKKLSAANLKLRQKIKPFQPRGLYLVIDTGANHLYMMKDDAVLRDAVVSTGSGVKLSDPDKPRSWVFDTPRGEFTIHRKVNEPVWTKPDWAFVEAGENLPKGYDERVEEGVLGDYAMDLGDGYLIHGTLFERALGLHVTHGCVRVGSKDLEQIFKSVAVGTRVYII
ncbi:MAG TPA: L,D-transpeptidase, partial [Patescibacteria group bacterium]|nr:L,D-transpeptidase [Patescibacteria group bacterium]